MQEIIVNGLLTVVVLTAAVLRSFIGTRADSGMTKKQKKMLVIWSGTASWSRSILMKWKLAV